MNDLELSQPIATPIEPAKTAPSTAREIIPWSSLGKAAATAVGAAAAAFHFIGEEAYERYLAHWGFGSGALPLEASVRVHYGYMAVFESIHTLLNCWFGAALLISLLIMLCLQFWFAALTKQNPPEKSAVGEWLKRFVGRLPRWVRSFLAAFGVSGLIVAFLYYLVLAAFIGLAAAPVIGEHAANKWAEHKEDQIRQGCQRTGKHSVCTELTRDGKAIGTGLIIASSPTHIAYFDMNAKHARLIKFEDGELTGWMP